MAVINKMGRVLLASGETASSESDELLLALLAIVGALLVAVITAGISLLSARRDRRRELYGEAVAAVSAWVELLYRVRRRGENAERELIDRAHDMQDELRFHSAWIGSESLFLKRSYDRMTRNVKSATEQLIRDAWQEPLRDPPGDARPEDVHPAVDEFMDSFLRDVRAQLSWLPPRKIAFFWRNRKGSPTTNKFGIRVADHRHAKSPEDMGWTMNIDRDYSVSVSATQFRGKKQRNPKPLTSDGHLVFAPGLLRFRAETSGPGQTQTWWQVANTGAHARERNGLRGGIFRGRSIQQHIASDDPNENWEPTKYTGAHLVRAMLVQDQKVVAMSDWFIVNIFSNLRRHFSA